MSIEHGPEPSGIVSVPQGFQRMSSALWDHGPQPIPIEDDQPQPILIEDGIESASQGVQPDSSMLVAIQSELDQTGRLFSDVLASMQSED